MYKLVISISLGVTIPILVLTGIRLVKLWIMANRNMGFVPPWLRNVFTGRARSSNPNIQHIPRTIPTSTSTTSTFWPYEENRICRAARDTRHLGFSTRDAAQAIRAMGQAGVRAGRAARAFQRAISNLPNRGDIMSEYQMGRVDRLLITMPDGNEITVESPVVEIYIEQETLEHFSSGSRVADRSVVVNEEIRARVGVREDQFFEAIRLIRED